MAIAGTFQGDLVCACLWGVVIAGTFRGDLVSACLWGVEIAGTFQGKAAVSPAPHRVCQYLDETQAGVDGASLGAGSWERGPGFPLKGGSHLLSTCPSPGHLHQDEL